MRQQCNGLSRLTELYLVAGSSEQMNRLPTLSGRTYSIKICSPISDSEGLKRGVQVVCTCKHANHSRVPTEAAFILLSSDKTADGGRGICNWDFARTSAVGWFQGEHQRFWQSVGPEVERVVGGKSPDLCAFDLRNRDKRYVVTYIASRTPIYMM